ncbi:MAG: tyrosine-type recombinase/integrase [Hyphomicrobiales bacterium]|nr:tyrosine-type recombinase/integrase [Hyphomicrobiales bacterium]
MMDAVDSYLEVRRAAGFELVVPEYLLRSFARFATARQQSHVHILTAIEWASQAPSMNQRFHRLSTVTRFADHVQVEDPRHELPPGGIFGRRRTRRTPFIYTPEEVGRLLRAASELKPSNSLRPHTYRTLFALLVTTGLRISEALALTFQDITDAGLIIRKTKFKKSRMVPLHESAKAGLERYLRRRERVAAFDNHIFISLRQKVLDRSGVTYTFRQILKEIDLHPGPNGRRPRIHDLRHTFACWALESCPQGREKVNQHLRALSTYMGHVKISDTYWYLEAIPQLMQSIANACESLCSGGHS